MEEIKEIKTVKAEQSIDYSVDCPECEETMYSNLEDDWDADEMIHMDQKIVCSECFCEFYVSY